MTPSTIVSPDKISPGEFGESLGKYPPLIKVVSDAKGGKSGLLLSGLETPSLATPPSISLGRLSLMPYSQGWPTDARGAGSFRVRRCRSRLRCWAAVHAANGYRSC